MLFSIINANLSNFTYSARTSSNVKCFNPFSIHKEKKIPNVGLFKIELCLEIILALLKWK